MPRHNYTHTIYIIIVKCLYLHIAFILTSAASKSLEKKHRGAPKQNGLIDLSVNKQFQLLTDCLIHQGTILDRKGCKYMSLNDGGI